MIARITRVKGQGYFVSFWKLIKGWKHTRDNEGNIHYFIDLESAEKHIRQIDRESWIKYVNC